MSTEALRTTGNSSHVIRDIFALHFPDVETVLDMTFGLGAFWRGWEHAFTLTTNDPYRPADTQMTVAEIRDHGDSIDWYDVIVFDPPFVATGPSADSHQTRYGGYLRR